MKQREVENTNNLLGISFMWLNNNYFKWNRKQQLLVLCQVWTRTWVWTWTMWKIGAIEVEEEKKKKLKKRRAWRQDTTGHQQGADGPSEKSVELADVARIPLRVSVCLSSFSFLSFFFVTTLIYCEKNNIRGWRCGYGLGWGRWHHHVMICKSLSRNRTSLEHTSLFIHQIGSWGNTNNRFGEE